MTAFALRFLGMGSVVMVTVPWVALLILDLVLVAVAGIGVLGLGGRQGVGVGRLYGPIGAVGRVHHSL